ncbi:uncharacterized protein KY384_003449 [Bacidia gigantensis]|uniref:uncharacterized protein n=1 Tax=Bacidia gigantensis TaxID=2732470 RepID=UPI001D03E538|nr:uncharacterized protein KY384_003449 [Bacidia gigantensis]KAG8531813.1 hypothetical protein KY384_003449 [Bacidia gigantensis]
MGDAKLIPNKYLELCPDLAALVDVAWKSTLKSSNQLHATSYLRTSEAAANSIKIGQGASFLVTRKNVPPVEAYWSSAKPKDGITVQPERPWKSKAGYQIVYKIARIQFNSEGDPLPSQRVTYASTLLDLMVLSHGPVMKHPHIIKFLGLAWADNGHLDTCPIPVPILEHAAFGNLADYQETKSLSVEKQYELLHQVGTAMKFLHANSITHGDVKSENVLLVADPEREFVAKLSDFGFAVLGSEGYFNFLPRGTLLWSAPEVRAGTLKTVEAPLSDVYSFGLLCWRVALDGIDPLCAYFLTDEQVVPPNLHRLDRESLEVYMREDMMCGRASPSMWMFKLVLLQAWRASRGEASVSNFTTVFTSALSIATARQPPWMVVLQSTLAFDPGKRDLSAAIAALRDHAPNIAKTPAAESIEESSAYNVLQANNTTVSWNSLRLMPPAVSNHIFEQKCRKLESSLAAGQKGLAQFAYGLACCSFSGMGSDHHLDTTKAIKYLLIAAQHGSLGAIAVVPRVCRTFNKNVSDITPQLKQCAQWGSQAALEDLPRISMDAYREAKAFLHGNMCGIGAQLFRWYNPPWLMQHVKSMDYVEDFIKKSDQKPSEIMINPRGDYLLSSAASLGVLDLVIRLVEHHSVSINQLNEQGESALHCAMRSGHPPIVLWLLDHGINVFSKGTYHNETPLHWLISIEPEETEAIALRLLSTEEGKVALSTWAQPCRYAATLMPGYNDRWDNLTYGSPLHWAICRKRLDVVKILLAHGSDPNATGDSWTNMAAMDLAAFLHEDEILQTMIDFAFPKPRYQYIDLGKRNTVNAESNVVEGGTIPRGLSYWIREAINGCDPWKMLFRFGEKWEERMKATFRILGEELKFAHLNSGVDELENTPLGFAAQYGYHEAVEKVLEHMNGLSTVNEPNSVGHWTPICWAIHRDNKRMFYKLLDKGSDMHVRINSPNRKNWFNWTLLHVAARSVIKADLELATKLLDEGIPVDGLADPACGGPAQTPLAIAVEENQFQLADLLRRKGANVNACCHYIDFQRRKLKYPCSILGCVVAANLRFSGSRLKYLLWPKSEAETLEEPSFIVVPEAGLTALHVAAMGADFLDQEEERDPDIASDILSLLLEKYEDAEQVNAQTKDLEWTALHIAVDKLNVEFVRQLLEADENDVGVRDSSGLTAFDLCRDIVQHAEETETSRFAAAKEICIIVKETLRRSDGDEDPGMGEIAKNTKAILFLGTPHRGSSYAPYGELLRKVASAVGFDTNDANLRALHFSSLELQLSQEEFMKIWRKRDLTVRTFQESTGFAGVRGLTEKIVPDMSSSFEDTRERAQHLPGNHMSMCRFQSPQDAGYTRICGEIQEILRDLSAQADVDQPASLKDMFVSQQQATSRHILKINCQKVLESLEFPQLLDRQRTIRTPVRGTGEWLIRTTEYLAWVQGGHRLLWLKGKAGSGKSTVMKRTLLHLQQVFPAESHTVAAYFFDGSGVELQRSTCGLLRTVLYQVFMQHRALLEEFVLTSDDGRFIKGKVLKWSLEELMEVLTILTSLKMWKPTIVVLDALDESPREDLLSLLFYLENLCPEEDRNSTRRLRLMISSRHYPNITLNDCPEIWAEKRNQQDIEIFARMKLSPMSQSVDNKYLVESLLQKAEGVFLWVDLTTQALLIADSDGEPLSRKMEALSKTPKRLGDLYHQILSKLSHQERTEAFHIFKLVLFASRRLSPLELYFSLQFDIVRPVVTLPLWTESNQYIDNGLQLEKFIRSRSRGLLEIVKLDSSLVFNNNSSLESIQFIHQTMPEFLLREGLNLLEPSLSFSSVAGVCHHEIATLCILYLSQPQIITCPSMTLLRFAVSQLESSSLDSLGSIGMREDASRVRAELVASYQYSSYAMPPDQKLQSDRLDEVPYLTAVVFWELPILKYAVSNLEYHLREAAKSSVSQGPLIDFLIHEESKCFLVWYALQNALYLPRKHRLHSVDWTDLLQVFVGLELESCVHEIRTRVINKELQLPTHWKLNRALSLAISLHSSCMAFDVISCGVDINERDINNLSHLDNACQRGHKNIVKVLLDAGADVKARNALRSTALHHAVHAGAVDVIQLLLDAKSDLEAPTFLGETPLLLAVADDKLDVVKLLMKLGANQKATDSQHRGMRDIVMTKYCPAVDAFLNPDTASTRSMPRLLGAIIEPIERSMTASPSPERQAERMSAFQQLLPEPRRRQSGQDHYLVVPDRTRL